MLSPSNYPSSRLSSNQSEGSTCNAKNGSAECATAMARAHGKITQATDKLLSRQSGGQVRIRGCNDGLGCMSTLTHIEQCAH